MSAMATASAPLVPPGLPPGPRIPLLESLLYLRDPHRYYAKMLRRFGDPHTLPTLQGPLVVTGHPDGARALLSLTDEQTAFWLPELMSTFVGTGSEMVMSGEAHKRERKFLTV